MKKILKIIVLFVILSNFATVFFISVFVLVPSLKMTDLKVTDLLTNNITDENFEAIKNTTNQYADEKGKIVGDKLVTVLRKLFYSDEYKKNIDNDYIEWDRSDYPYQSMDEVLDMVNDNVEIGLQQGLDALNEMNNN